MPTEPLPLRRLTAQGLAAFNSFIDGHSMGSAVPASLLDNPANTDDFLDGTLDPSKEFSSRYEFGQYLVAQLQHLSFDSLVSPQADWFWAWVAALYFPQLSSATARSKSPKKSEHFLVTRQAFRGSLHYRQGPRTSFELVHVHGPNARVCLCGPMGTFGDITEQLASTFSIARNLGYFRAAATLYLDGHDLRRGAASRARHPRKRRPGERRGMGGAGRLVKAFNRLTLTYDTAEMTDTEILNVLPSEFKRFLVTNS